jgi:hypothetical protein
MRIENDPVRGTAGVGETQRLFTLRGTALAARRALETHREKEKEDLLWTHSQRIYNYLSDLYPDLERNPYRSPRLIYTYLEHEEFGYCHIALERTWISIYDEEDICRFVVTIPVRGSGTYRSFVSKSVPESEARKLYASVIAKAEEAA